MECRTVRELSDAFVSDELAPDAYGAILHHLHTCAVCRLDIDTRERVRRSLREAFERAPELQATPEFRETLRQRLALSVAGRPRRRTQVQAWFAVAAMVALVAGLTAVVVVHRWATAPDAAVIAAVGDHRNCALKFRLSEKPISLEEAAQRYDPAYRLLESVPANAIATAHGPARVLERHLCVFAGRRFAHLVLRYRGQLVSLVIVENEQRGTASDALRHDGRIDAMPTVSFRTARFTVVITGNLENDELTDLGETVGHPVARRLAGV